LALRLNDNGTLDSSFGQNGVITVDFGSTSGVTTDGGRSVALRTVNGAVDILVAGYTLEASTGKYRIALVDLLDQNTINIA
jgi:hypothetical protein